MIYKLINNYMRQCIKCKEIKFWFQFYSKDMTLYTATYDICKKCAKRILNDKLDEYLDKNNII